MTNFQVYKKVLPFSLLHFAVDLLAFVVLAACAGGGYLIFNNSTDRALIGLVIGTVIGIILAILITVFIGNRIKAAQIAMIAKGVTENQLPEHTFKEGFNEIKGRFGKITAFFFITGAIKGIFRQITRVINKVGTALGGQTGNAITSAIDTGVQVLLGYLCDCCLGWIFFRKDLNSARAGCEGAIIFFKKGKTLIRNVGRIFGMGILSLLLVGGACFGILTLIFHFLPQIFNSLSAEIVEMVVRNGGDVADIPEFVTNTTALSLIFAGLAALILWSAIHSVFGRPFILVGVMRNFMTAGQEEMPTDKDFAELSSKSPKFAKLANKAE